MRLLNLKNIFATIIFSAAFVFVSSTNTAYAIDCDTYEVYTAGGSTVTVPSPAHILCPVFKLANAAVLLVGVVLAAMLAVGAIKLATSLGDPKGLDAASRTWTYAVVGTGVVIGAVSIIAILTRIFGLEFGGTENIFASATEGLNNFLLDIGVVTDGGGP